MLVGWRVLTDSFPGLTGRGRGQILIVCRCACSPRCCCCDDISRLSQGCADGRVLMRRALVVGVNLAKGGALIIIIIVAATTIVWGRAQLL